MFAFLSAVIAGIILASCACCKCCACHDKLNCKKDPSISQGDADADADAVAVAAKTTKSSASKTRKYTREVIAKPGKLGVVIASAGAAPAVKSIKVGSPMEGKLYVGDLITSIDGEDCWGMTSTDITELLAKTQEQERTIVVLGDLPKSVACPAATWVVAAEVSPTFPDGSKDVEKTVEEIGADRLEI